MSKLDETFNLPTDMSSDELEKVRKTLAEQTVKVAESAEESDELAQEISPYAEMAFDEIAQREKRVDELIDMHQFDSDQDKIFDETFQAFRDAFMIAKDVPPQHAGKIFEAAAQFGKIALDAKSSKLKMRLDAIDLALKKRRLDATEGKGDSPVNADSSFLDRNEILDSIKQMAKDIQNKAEQPKT